MSEAYNKFFNFPTDLEQKFILRNVCNPLRILSCKLYAITLNTWPEEVNKTTINVSLRCKFPQRKDFFNI